MPRNYMPSFGPCCGCGTMRAVRNILALHKLHPKPGQGWGCFVCGLPANGAIAVVCDRCLNKEPLELKFACAGRAADRERVPYESLEGEFKHDETKHQQQPVKS